MTDGKRNQKGEQAVNDMGGVHEPTAELEASEAARQQTEKVLRESEERYRAIFDQAADSITLVDAETGALVEFNRRAHENLGYTREEFEKLKVPDFEVIESAEKVKEHIERVVKQGVDTFETKHRTKAGALRDVQVNSRAICLGGKQFVQSIWRDITDRKRAEEALRQSEEAERNFGKQLAALQEACNELSQSVSVDELCRLAVEFGRSRLGFDRMSVWLVSSNPSVLTGTFGVDEEGNLRDERNCRIAPAPGSATWRLRTREASSFHAPDAPLYNDNSQVIGRGSQAIAGLWDGREVIGYVSIDNLLSRQPITERQRELLSLYASAVGHLCTRKRAEQALRESEKGYRLLADNVTDVIWTMDMNLRFTYVSPSVTRMLGYSVEETLTKTLEEVVTPGWIKRALEVLKQELAAEKTEEADMFRSRTLEIELIRKDGSTMLAEGKMTFLREPDGRPIGILGVARDIAERKRAEKERETFARLGTRLAAAATVESMIAIVREETEDLLPWDAHYFAVRRPEEDTFHVVSFADIVDGRKKTFPGEDWPSANLSPELRQLLDGHPVLINRAPGIPGPVLSRFGNKARLSASILDVPVRSGNNIVGILSVQSYTPGRYNESDLHTLQRMADAIAPALERARVEEALQEAQAHFRTLFENVPIGLYRTTPDGRILMANPALVRMLGYSSFSEMAQRNLERNGFEPGYSRSVFKERVEREGQVFGLDAPWTRRDGTVMIIRESARAVRDGAGNVLYYEGTAEDITEQKRTEAKLDEMFEEVKKSRDDLLAILNMLRLGIVMVDENCRVAFLNESARHLIGKGQKAALGDHWEKLFSFAPRDRARLRDMVRWPPKARKKVQAQVQFRKGEGRWIDIEVRDDPRDPERKMFFFYDVTEVYDLRRMLEEKAQFHDLVGKSKLMQSVYQRIQEVSRVDWTVLIEGETGTGKELVARAIHFSSPRKERPFVAVNCAGLTDSLLTSQLFGHKRGAFTGAVEDHKGLFEVAHGGTLFLDEIGDVSASMQTSLLRVLEEKKITPLGESRSRKIDVRILASTHRDLSQEAENGRFRPDLLYRIRVARIKLPLLRERREDIPLLVAAFLGQSRAATGKPVGDLSDDAMRILLEYDWPGNVRELKSAIDVATLHCKGSVIHVADLPPEILHSKYPQAMADGPSQDEKQRVLAALEGAKGNRTAAASLLGISRATLYRRLASLGIKPVK